MSTRPNSVMSAESEEIAYKRLSFEDLLFTSYVYKRNFRNRFTGKVMHPATSKAHRETKGSVTSAAASMVSTKASNSPSRTPSIVENKQSMSIDSISRAGFERLRAHRESPLEDSKRLGYYSSDALTGPLTTLTQRASLGIVVLRRQRKVSMIEMFNCTIYMIQSSNRIPRYARLLLRLKARHGALRLSCQNWTH